LKSCRIFKAIITRLGVLHLERGNLTDAIFRFTLVTRLAPKHVEAWLKLSEAQLKKGDQGAAKKALVQAKKLAPTHPDIPALTEKLANVFSSCNALTPHGLPACMRRVFRVHGQNNPLWTY
jgi:tetratricopeptide (TPR) repeat protein